MKRKLEDDSTEAVKENIENLEIMDTEEVQPDSEVVVEEVKKIDISTASLAQLLDAYNASFSADDLAIFERIKKAKKDLDVLPVFGPKGTEKISKLSNPLLAHSSKANIILSCLNDARAFTTSIQYSEEKVMENAPNPGGFYDLRFLLPILCHTLDEKNVCDPMKVVQNGWIYFIMRGMSLADKALRNAAFLAYKRLLFNLQQTKLAKNQDVKIWLHVLQSVRRGIQQLGECRVSHLVCTWLVAAWEVLKQPSHPMYNRLTTFLLAKPILEMSIIPEFIPFYNASDGNKESREWILNVLYWGLKNPEDWKLAQKLPVVKFLCSSFLLEKLKTKKNIVGILNRGARLQGIADLLIEKYSLPLWIAGIVTRDSYLQVQVSKLLTALRTNCTPSPSRDTLFDFVTKKMEANNVLASSLASCDHESQEDAEAEGDTEQQVAKTESS